ncbi:MAG TPA: 5'/3'-nucleotidase SurE [Ferrovibrio sp.]|jgi:5'-nucleotidase|uniref:5'/3'-nucleotidase SurE n=1 Tax=Ferrovibrio sp. TaxID=1917215 RepID=UPI002ED3EC7B
MRILVSNDDGIHAPGLKVLERIAKSLSKDVWVVAPEFEQSGASHSLTLTQPLRIRKINARKYAVRGTPTDCVMMAMHEILKDSKPDLLLSGVNRGSNLGEDVTYSGTVAVAMEGTLLGVPSIALSQKFEYGHPVKWATAEHHAPKVIKKLLRAGWPKGVLINVNFPDVVHDSVTGIEVVKQGQRDLTDLSLDSRVDARGVPYFWIGFRRQKNKSKRQSDLGAIDNGAISVTPLQLDLTHGASLKALKSALS